MINITVNNKPYTFTKPTSLQEALNGIAKSLNGIAVAVNGAIIPKTDWSLQQLNNHDTILIIQATQGG